MSMKILSPKISQKIPPYRWWYGGFFVPLHRNMDYLPKDPAILIFSVTISGLENILAACSFPVNTVVGGFHLLDDHETEEELTALAQRLKAKYPNTQFFTSHCTGDTVFTVLKDVMGDQIQPFSCGTNIILTNNADYGQA